MDYTLLTKSFVVVALLALAVTVAPAAGLHEGPVERSLKLPGLQVMPLNIASSMDSTQAAGPAQSISYPTMAMPQRPENNNQSKSASVFSPGTDATVYVPGSTAQSFSQLDAFKLGRVMLRPSARLTYGYDSNFFNLSGGGSSAEHFFLVEPSIEAFVPVTQNGIRLEYTAGYRKSPNYDLAHKFSHSFNADSLFDFTPILSLAIREHFALGSLNTSEYVPGREIIFSDAQFKRNNVEAQLNWTATENDNLGFNAGWNKVLFDKNSSSAVFTDGGRLVTGAPFYDYNEYRLGGFYRRAVSQRTGLFVNGSYFRDVTQDPRDIADSTAFETLVGIDSMLTPLASGQFSVGFRSTTFPGAPSQDFRGTIFRGSLQKEITETIRVSLAASRSTNLSAFQNNAYFLTHGIGLTYIQELGPKFLLSISPGYQRNSYPTLLLSDTGISSSLVGVKSRVDRMLELSIDAHYRHSEWVALDFLFGVFNRDSVIPEFRFTDYRASVSLLFGLRGISRGQTPY